MTITASPTPAPTLRSPVLSSPYTGTVFGYRDFASASGLKSAYVNRLKQRGDLDDALVQTERGVKVRSEGFALAHLADEVDFLRSRGLSESAAASVVEQVRRQLPAMWQFRCAGIELGSHIVVEYEDGQRQ